MPRSPFQCTNNIPTDWPKQWIGENGPTVSAGTVGICNTDVKLALKEVIRSYKTFPINISIRRVRHNVM